MKQESPSVRVGRKSIIAFCSVVSDTQHGAVIGCDGSTFAPWGDVVGFHLFQGVDFCSLTLFVASSAVGAVGYSALLCVIGLFVVCCQFCGVVEEAYAEELGVFFSAEDVFVDVFLCFDGGVAE